MNLKGFVKQIGYSSIVAILTFIMLIKFKMI